MTLPAFAAKHRRLQHGAGRSAANLPAAVAAIDRRDIQADARTPVRYIDPGPRH